MRPRLDQKWDLSYFYEGRLFWTIILKELSSFADEALVSDASWTGDLYAFIFLIEKLLGAPAHDSQQVIGQGPPR